MMAFFELPFYWYWWMFACLLFMSEMVMPDLFFMPLSFAAVIVGTVHFFMPEMTFAWQLITFCGASIVALIVSKVYLNEAEPTSDNPLLNRRAEQFIGRSFTLKKPIEDGVGNERLDGSYWRLIGADCPAGTRVKVVNADGISLQVKRVESVHSA